MAYDKTCYLQHTAVYVKDIQWHTRFFGALGMPVRRVAGDPEDPQQVWTVGGMQLVSDKTFEGPEGRMAHLGIYADDLEAALEEASSGVFRRWPRDTTGSGCPMGWLLR
jgi:catechol 2,3-dioxygenase-like lactoylglutathione lyase family enzyme